MPRLVIDRVNAKGLRMGTSWDRERWRSRPFAVCINALSPCLASMAAAHRCPNCALHPTWKQPLLTRNHHPRFLLQCIVWSTCHLNSCYRLPITSTVNRSSISLQPPRLSTQCQYPVTSIDTKPTTLQLDNSTFTHGTRRRTLCEPSAAPCEPTASLHSLSLSICKRHFPGFTRICRISG